MTTAYGNSYNVPQFDEAVYAYLNYTENINSNTVATLTFDSCGINSALIALKQTKIKEQDLDSYRMVSYIKRVHWSASGVGDADIYSESSNSASRWSGGHWVKESGLYTYTYPSRSTLWSRSISRPISFARGHYSYNVNFTCEIVIGSLASGSPNDYASVSGSFSIPPKPSYQVVYNANGGYGGPGNQIKWFDEPLVLSSGIPSRANHRFLGWSTSSSGGVNYNPGSTYYGNEQLALYAVWERMYTVSYNANDGSGAPGQQIKYANSNLTLSTTIPTRFGYEFLGWGTTWNATEINYRPGETYSTNEDITLYAVWKLLFKVDISSFSVSRINAEGFLDSTGEYLLATGFYTISGEYPLKAVPRITWGNNQSDIANVQQFYIDGSTGEYISTTEVVKTQGGNPVKAKFIYDTHPISDWEGVLFSADEQFDITSVVDIYRTDADPNANVASASVTSLLTRGEFILDFDASGHGMGIGCPSPDQGLAINWPTEFRNMILGLFPIGYVYISTSSANPETFFGGKWRRIQGKYLYALDTESSGSDIGATSFTIGYSNLPPHDHSLPDHNHSFSADTGSPSINSTDPAGGHSHTVSSRYNYNELRLGTNGARWLAAGANISTGMSSVNYTGEHQHTLNDHRHNVSGTTGGMQNTVWHTGDGTGTFTSSPIYYKPLGIALYVWERYE